MGDPPTEDGIGRSVDFVQVPVRPATHVPIVVQALPTGGAIAVGRIIEAFHVRGVEGPRIDEIPKHVTFHRYIDAGRDGRSDHDRLQTFRHLLGGSPRGVAGVAAAVHAHSAVAPRLRADPINQRGRI